MTYTTVILIALFGFLALAAILLVPVYRFIQREERVSRAWTPEALEAHERTLRQPEEPDADPHAGTEAPPR